MSSKEALIRDIKSGMSVSAAAKLHEVARSCAYKWLQRSEQDPIGGLEEWSRAPEYSPNRTAQAIVDELLELKRKHPDLGPAKLSVVLESIHDGHVMASSTAGQILSRHGMVVRRRSGRRAVDRIEHARIDVGGAGHSMTTDFKGQFRLRNGQWCYPLTIADPISRYVFAVEALRSTHGKGAREVYDRIFREYGIPWQIISDNGSPFCSACSLGGLTQLSKWWIEMGIIPVRTQPGRPDQNGVHERMHRTLKQWIRRLARSDMRSQQRSFNAFLNEFNHVRPHQSLGQKPPVTALKAYRPYESRIRSIEYDSTMNVRLVNANGQIKWKGVQIFISEVLIGSNIGLREVDEALYTIHFGPVRLGFLDLLTRRVSNRAPERGKESKSSSSEESKPDADLP